LKPLPFFQAIERFPPTTGESFNFEERLLEQLKLRFKGIESNPTMAKATILDPATRLSTSPTRSRRLWPGATPEIKSVRYWYRIKKKY